MRKYGSTERQQKRENTTVKIRNDTNNLILEVMPELQENIILNNDNYINKIIELNRRISAEFQGVHAYKTARNYLTKFINEGNKSGKWYYPVPEPLIRLQRVNPLRTINWFLNTKNVSVWAKSWESSSEPKKSIRKDTNQELLPKILCSAMLYGGLCIPEAITSLANMLIDNPKEILYSHDNIFWIDIEFDDNKQILNKRIKNNKDDTYEEISLKRWYPDNLTLLRIHNYLKNNEVKQQGVIKLNTKSCWELISKYLKIVDSVAAKPLNSFELFCRSAIGYTENLNSIDLNQALVEYAIGRNLSASLTKNSQNNLFNTEKNITLTNTKFSQAKVNTTKVYPSNYKKQLNTITQYNYEKLIESIRIAIKSSDSNGFKTPKHSCQQKLEAILQDDDLPLNVFYLLSWFIYLLNKNQVSSINTYFSRVGQRWITSTIDLDLSLLDEFELEALYSIMLDGEYSERNKSYMKGRLKQLHTFCYTRYDFSYLHSFNSTESNRIRGFVRADFITDNQFLAILKTIDNLTHIDHIINKNALKCILIIAFRTGMRISEVLKVHLREIENSTEFWIYVVINKVNGIKSLAAKRKLPLETLLTPEESRFVRNYLHSRVNQTNYDVKDDQSTLAFSKPLNEYGPLDKQSISQIFKFIVEQLFEQNLTFHTLRHSALSRLQLVIENDIDFLKFISNYTIDKILQIQSILGSYHRKDVNKDKYWAVSGFAGHNTPETTFYSYLHFSDRLLGKQLSLLDIKLNKNQLYIIAGISVRKINAGFQERNEIHIKEAILLIEKQLKKYSKIIGDSGKKIVRTEQYYNEPLQIQVNKNKSFENCLSALKKAEQGETIINICNQLNVDENTLNKWLKNADYLSTLTTSKGKPRLFSSQKSPTLSGKHLLPPEVSSHKELKDVNSIVTRLRTLYKAEQKAIHFCMEYFQNNKTHESSGLIFKKPDELIIFTSLLSQVLPKKRIHLYFSSLDNSESKDILNDWRNSIKQATLFQSTAKVKNQSLYPFGKIELSLAHPNEEKIIQKRSVKKYSTNALSFVIHMLAIMTIN